MNPIQHQFTLLSQTLFAQDTGVTYKQAAVKTWEVLKQTALLIYLLALLVVVVLVWLWSTGFRKGYCFRKWLETEQPTLERLLLEAGKLLLKPFELVADWSQSQVKELLGIEVKALAPAADPKALAPVVEKSVCDRDHT
jgi:hypothetical protein